ncbi:hypothetical protein DW793_01840 [Ruminococcus sp. AM31-15AC]|nr:hypothetical protein DW793_01840 [Ruminococcus sp. AM31-15AC]
MITKKTFMTIVNALDFGICKCRQFCEVNNLSLEETNEFIHGGNLQNDLLKMLKRLCSIATVLSVILFISAMRTANYSLAFRSETVLLRFTS